MDSSTSREALPSGKQCSVEFHWDSKVGADKSAGPVLLSMLMSMAYVKYFQFDKMTVLVGRI